MGGGGKVYDFIYDSGVWCEMYVFDFDFKGCLVKGWKCDWDYD